MKMLDACRWIAEYQRCVSYVSAPWPWPMPRRITARSGRRPQPPARSGLH